MNKLCLPIFTIFTFFSSNLALGASDFGDEMAWGYYDHSFLGASEENSKIYTIFESAICNYDNLESLVCFDYGWKDTCLEFFVVYKLSDSIPYIFNQNKVPVVQIGRYEKIDINPIFEMEQIIKQYIIPRSVDGDFVFWRIAVGNLETHKNSTEGAIFQLLNEKRINIFFELQNGTVMRSHASLKGVRALLETALEKAQAVKPEGPECS